MFEVRGVVLAAVGALIAAAGSARAAEPVTGEGAATVANAVQPSDLRLGQPKLLAEAAGDPSPMLSIMGIADRLGVKKPLLDPYNIRIGGWTDRSVTYDARSGKNIPGRVFDFESQDTTANQTVVFIERAIDTKKNQFQIGGRMEWMWGSDARVIHSNGLFDHYGVNDGPENQFDLTQLYIDLYFPIGNGLTVRAGKFVTLLGAETIDPNNNVLYSHSFLFGYAIPFTHTGAYATYAVNDKLSVTGGFSRGWEQSLEDNNGCAIDLFGQVAYTISDKQKLTATFIGGPERAGNTDDYRYVLDVIYTHRISDQLTLTFNGDWGFEQDGATNGSDAQWFGAAFYANYVVAKDVVDLNVRGEWFEDPNGARGLGVTGSVWEVTIGLDIHPLRSIVDFASLRIRPEVRYDYSNDQFFGQAGNKHDQWTFGVDMIIAL